MFMQRNFHFHQAGFHAAHGAAAAFCALFSSVICMGVAVGAASIFVFRLMAALVCVGIGVVTTMRLGSRCRVETARSCSCSAPSDVSA